MHTQADDGPPVKAYNVKISFLTEQDTPVYDAASRDQARFSQG
jgi:hypothetical protein